MKKFFVLLFFLLLLCYTGLVETHDIVESDAFVEAYDVSDSITSLQNAIALVAREYSPDSTVVVTVTPSLWLYESGPCWSFSIIYWDIFAHELMHQGIDVYSYDTGCQLLKDTPSKYPEIAYHFDDPFQVALVYEQVDMWEQVYGPWYFWPLDVKASFYEEYKLSPAYFRDWGRPEDGERSYAQARSEVDKLVYERFQVNLDQLDVRENVQCIIEEDGSEGWEFTYWARIRVDNEIHWGCVFEFQDLDNKFYMLHSVDQKCIDMLRIPAE